MANHRERIAAGDGYAIVEKADAEGNLKLELEWAPGLEPSELAKEHALYLVVRSCHSFENTFKSRADPDYETRAKVMSLFADAARRDEIKKGAAYRRKYYNKIARALLLLPELKVRLNSVGRVFSNGHFVHEVRWLALRNFRIKNTNIELTLETVNMGTLTGVLDYDYILRDITPRSCADLYVGFLQSDSDALDLTTLKAAVMSAVAADLIAHMDDQAYVDARLKQIYPEFYLLPGETLKRPREEDG